ncbi:hypothetical protein L1887_39391 [Cichorium endivia]|nr:hypothetical protein L1887_39391 [Cichorium endivia]
MDTLIVYTPFVNVVKYASTPTTPIVVQPTNVYAVYEFLAKLPVQGLEVFLQIVTSHPLHYALSDFSIHYTLPFPHPTEPSEVANTKEELDSSESSGSSESEESPHSDADAAS